MATVVMSSSRRACVPDPQINEVKFISLPVTNRQNNAIESLRVLPRLSQNERYLRVRPGSDLLRSGVLLENATGFLEAVRTSQLMNSKK